MTESGSTSERERFLTGYAVRALDDYERGEIGLGRMVTEVEIAFEELSTFVESAWVSEMGSTWFELETVYAIMLDEGRAHLTDHELAVVDETIAKLRVLLSARR